MIIINHKGTRMVKDGKHSNGIQTRKLRNLGQTFQSKENGTSTNNMKYNATGRDEEGYDLLGKSLRISPR